MTTVTEPSNDTALRLIQLRASNFMRLEALTINADGRHVVISGPNGSGKTSSVDAIWAALGGKSAREMPEPVHRGSQRAAVHLDLDEYTVERTWDDRGTRLTVTARDGSRVRKPQELLDGLLGKYSLDPVSFLERRPQDQVDDVLALCGVEPPVATVQEITGEDHPRLRGESASSYLERLSADDVGQYYVRRREANRACDQKRAALEEHRGIVQQLGGPVKPGEPPPSTSELVAELQTLNGQDAARRAAFQEVHDARNGLAATQTKLNGLRVDKKRAGESVGRINAEIARLQEQIARLQRELVEERGSASAIDERIAAGEKALSQWQEEVDAAEAAAAALPDVSREIKSVSDEIARAERSAQTLSRRVHATEQLERLAKEVARAQADHKELDEKLAALRDLRVHLLDGVDLGVPGLEAGQGELRLNGVSFRQASQAQRIRVAAAVAMRQRPRLRLLRVDDAEHLDSESKRLLLQVAEENGFQVIMTTVSDDSGLKVEIVGE